MFSISDVGVNRVVDNIQGEEFSLPLGRGQSDLVYYTMLGDCTMTVGKEGPSASRSTTPRDFQVGRLRDP